MALRCAAGLAEAKKQFRRVNGRLHLQALQAAPDEHVAASVTPPPTLPNRRWPHSSAARGRHPSSTPSGTSSGLPYAAAWALPYSAQ